MIYSCPYCHRNIESDIAGKQRCPYCDNVIMIEAEGTSDAMWGKATSKNWLRPLYETFVNSLTQPEAFFGRISKNRGFVRPYIYALIISFIVFVFAAVYKAGFGFLAQGFVSAAGGPLAMFPQFVLTVPIGIISVLLFFVLGVPFAALFMTFIRAGLYHICLMILGAAKRDYAATYNVVCYASGPQIFQIVPILGGFVGTIWQLALDVIGLKVAHQTTYVKSLIAVFLPMMLCCGLILMFIMVIAGGVFAAVFSS